MIKLIFTSVVLLAFVGCTSNSTMARKSSGGKNAVSRSSSGTSVDDVQEIAQGLSGGDGTAASIAVQLNEEEEIILLFGGA